MFVKSDTDAMLHACGHRIPRIYRNSHAIQRKITIRIPAPHAFPSIDVKPDITAPAPLCWMQILSFDEYSHTITFKFALY